MTKDVLSAIVDTLQSALDDFDGCEINMSNYGEDEVADINNAYIGFFGAMEDAIKKAQNALALNAAPVPACDPTKYKLVPIEPTDEMIEKGEAAADETAQARLFGMNLAWRPSENPSVERYKAMVSYAPQPPAAPSLTVADYEEVIEDHKRLVLELDIALNGAHAAIEPSLCDIVAQVKSQGIKAPAAPAVDLDVLQEAFQTVDGWGNQDRDKRLLIAESIIYAAARAYLNQFKKDE